MKIPLSWLKKYIDINETPEELSHLLTMAGLEVDSVEEYRPKFTGIVVADVRSAIQHPDAENLRVATVFDGIDEYQVVCGASNCRAGIRVAFARIGSLLGIDSERPLKIKKSKLRGIESAGMLCSEEELGLADSSDGIIELPEEFSVGEDLAAEFGDILFEISLTPNLGHCLSIIGVAREIAAITGRTLRYPEYTVVENGDKNTADMATVIVEDSSLCLRYCCRIIRNITVGPSPLWLQNKLIHCGFKSVNNIVDATNYVLMEYGHPLHAFDYNALAKHTLLVRTASGNESFTTLDGEERTLHEGALLVCDGSKPVAIAGVMGGKNSEVNNATVDLLIESAYFDPTTVRKTSKILGMTTEASKRFERGVDINNVPHALNRVTALIVEIAGGSVAEAMIDIKKGPFKKRIIPCRFSRINKLLGTALAINEVENIFKNLQFGSTWDGIDTFEVSIPSYRNDITAEIDLVEEVARIYGYNNITTSSPSYISSPLPHAPIFLFEKKMRTRFLNEGLQEFFTSDLLSPSLAEIAEGSGVENRSLVKVLNPISVEQSVLRASLLPGALQIIRHNIDHGTKDITGFEIGRIHLRENDGYREHSIAALTMTGKRSPRHWDSSANSSDVDFYDIKGIIENSFESIGIERTQFKLSSFENFHPKRQATIIIDDVEVGIVGELHPHTLNIFGIDQRVMFAEINLHNLFAKQGLIAQMAPLAHYPGSERDWTITVKDAAEAADITSIIRSAPSRLLESIEVRGIYSSDTIGKGLKNITFGMVYRDKRKTVSAEVVDADHKRIIKHTLDLLAEKEFINT